jgi:O-antigen/teichoic acid export membrane protein
MTYRKLPPNWRDIATTAAVRAYNLVVGTLSFVIIARLLGPEGQGTIAAAINWTALVATVAGLSLGHVAQHRIQVRRPNAWDGAIFSSLLLLLLVLTLLGYGIVIAAYFLTSGEFFGGLPPSVLVMAFTLLPLLIWDEYASNLLAAAGKIGSYNRIQVLGRTTGLALTVFLVGILNTGIHGALSASVTGQAIIAAGSLIVLWRFHKPILRIDFAEIGQLARGATRLHLNTIGSFLLASSSVLVLNSLSTRAEVGWYNLAWQMIMMLAIIPQAASLVLYANISADDPNRAWPAHKRITIGVMAIMVLLVGTAYMIGPSVVVILAGENFRPSGNLFQILLPALLGISLAQLMAPQWITRGIFVPTSLITIATATMHVAFTVVMVRNSAAAGAAWATALTLGMTPLIVQGYFSWWCEKKYRRSQAST